MMYHQSNDSVANIPSLLTYYRHVFAPDPRRDSFQQHHHRRPDTEGVPLTTTATTAGRQTVVDSSVEFIDCDVNLRDELYRVYNKTVVDVFATRCRQPFHVVDPSSLTAQIPEGQLPRYHGNASKRAPTAAGDVTRSGYATENRRYLETVPEQAKCRQSNDGVPFPEQVRQYLASSSTLGCSRAVGAASGLQGDRGGRRRCGVVFPLQRAAANVTNCSRLSVQHRIDCDDGNGNGKNKSSNKIADKSADRRTSTYVIRILIHY